MTNNSVNNKRIAKNTLLLYFRTLFIMLITLYTSRVVLNTLGVTDYGIYNVVGGVVMMFSVISSSLSSSISRIVRSLSSLKIMYLSKLIGIVQVHRQNDPCFLLYGLLLIWYPFLRISAAQPCLSIFIVASSKLAALPLRYASDSSQVATRTSLGSPVEVNWVPALNLEVLTNLTALSCLIDTGKKS